jgi:hypothetical protein
MKAPAAKLRTVTIRLDAETYGRLAVIAMQGRTTLAEAAAAIIRAVAEDDAAAHRRRG